jgi:hypothetical protein
VELRADDAGGYPTTQLLAKIKALREAVLRAEHVAFSFMKRKVQPLMARDTLGYQYTGDDDTSRMPGVKSTRRHRRQAGENLQGYAGVHAMPRARVLRRASTQ